MTPDRIAIYLDDLARALRAQGAYSRDLVDELGDHLLDSVEAGERRGLSADAAQEAAIARAGAPELVARHAAAHIPHRCRRALLIVCGATMGAVAFLSLSLLILRPPRANYRAWLVEAVLVLLLTGVTFAWARAGETRVRWSRPLLLLGSLALAAFGTGSVYRELTRDFEGYGLVLGALFSAQALLTLVLLHRRPRTFLPHA
jgi:hypothetical protein